MKYIIGLEVLAAVTIMVCPVAALVTVFDTDGSPVLTRGTVVVKIIAGVSYIPLTVEVVEG